MYRVSLRVFDVVSCYLTSIVTFVRLGLGLGLGLELELGLGLGLGLGFGMRLGLVSI